MRVAILSFTGLLLLTACSNPNSMNPNGNAGDFRVSPIPPGYSLLAEQQAAGRRAERAEGDRGTRVDALLASVEGQFLTRRAVVRRLGLDPAQANAPEHDEEIAAAVKQWAQEQLVMKAAERAGMPLRESAVDQFAAEQLSKLVEVASEEAGRVVTREQWLLEKRQTWDEFRDQMRRQLTYELYMRRMLSGLGPTRAEEDWGVTPSEVRRIYHDHRQAFDQKAGVRFAIFLLPLERYEQEGRSFLEAEQAAQRAAQELAAAVRTGVSAPAALAERFGLNVPGRELWRENKNFAERFAHPDVGPWLFDAARRPHDAIVFSDPAGPTVLAVLEVRPARSRTYDEVYDNIITLVRTARRRRLEATVVTDLITRGGSRIWPDVLADELLDDAQAVLATIEREPILKGVRLR